MPSARHQNCLDKSLHGMIDLDRGSIILLRFLKEKRKISMYIINVSMYYNKVIIGAAMQDNAAQHTGGTIQYCCEHNFKYW